MTDKCPLDRFTLYWCRDPNFGGIVIRSGGGEYNGSRLVPFEAVRADLYDALVTEKEKLLEKIARLEQDVERYRRWFAEMVP